MGIFFPLHGRAASPNLKVGVLFFYRIFFFLSLQYLLVYAYNIYNTLFFLLKYAGILWAPTLSIFLNTNICCKSIRSEVFHTSRESFFSPVVDKLHLQ